MKPAAKPSIFVLILLIILVTFSLSCGTSVSPGEALCLQFFKLIGQQQYAEAYTLLNESAQAKISKADFVSKYTAIANEMGITGIRLSGLTVKQTTKTAKLIFALTYDTNKIGELSDSYEMSQVVENGQWKIKWEPSLLFPNMGWGDTVRINTLKASRGEIFAGDTLIAANVNATTVYVNTAKASDMNILAGQLAPLLKMSESELQKKLNTTLSTVVLKKFLPSEMDAFTKQQLLSLNGVGIDERNFGTLRYYPQKTFLAHILGYVGIVSKEELDELIKTYPGEYDADSYIGKSGLEKKYEHALRGKDGWDLFIADSEGGKKSTLFTSPAQDGLDIRLTVNAALQSRAEEVLSLLLPNEAAAVVVLDPTTGAVKALASNPTYDLNLFVRGISTEKWNSLTNAKGNPLFNHAISGLYPPGSIFKPFTAAAALEKGVITANTEFKEEIVDNAWTPKEFQPWYYPAIRRIKMAVRPTPLNMKNAMITSDNIYFAYAALKTGMDSFRQFAQTLGIGEAIPFDLTTAASRLLNQKTEFNIKYLADSGYGQGEMLFTPLQLAATFGAFANNGNIMQPYIISGLFKTEGFQYNEVEQTKPAVWKQGVIAKSSISTIQSMLEAVVKEGTATALGETNVRVAGKTGTAQVSDNKKREIAWFAGYWIDGGEPRIALVMIETTANSILSSYRFTLAREMLKKSSS